MSLAQIFDPLMSCRDAEIIATTPVDWGMETPVSVAVDLIKIPGHGSDAMNWKKTTTLDIAYLLKAKVLRKWSPRSRYDDRMKVSDDLKNTKADLVSCHIWEHT